MGILKPFACLFFLLDSQVIRIFRLKNRLIILSAVTYVISWEDVFSSCEGSAGKLLGDHLLRDGSRLGEDVSGQ